MRIDNHYLDSPDHWRLGLTAATQQLLGDTITLSALDWRLMTALPGWSRAHVGAHLTHHARSLTAMATAISQTHQPVAWASQQTEADLNRMALRGAVELQEALDQSSAALMRACDAMDRDAWNTPLNTSRGLLPASAMVIDRLNHVVIHHIDLGLSLDFADLEPGLVRALLRWNLFRTSARFANVELTVTSDEGFTAVVGTGEEITVRGSEASILGWLVGRKDSTSVLGAESLDLAGPV